MPPRRWTSYGTPDSWTINLSGGVSPTTSSLARSGLLPLPLRRAFRTAPRNGSPAAGNISSAHWASRRAWPSSPRDSAFTTANGP